MAGHEKCGGHVDVHHRHHVLRVRVADEAIRSRRGDELFAAALDGEPGVGVLRRDLGHRLHEVPEPLAVALGQAPEVGAAGHVEHRERQPRLEDVVGDFGGVEGSLEREWHLLRIAVTPRQAAPLLLGPAHGVEGLGPGDERQVVFAAHDRGGRLVDEHLRRGAADAGVVPVPGLGTDALRQAGHRIVVGPGLAVHDANALELVDETGPARVLGGGPGHLLPHGQGLRCLALG